MPKETTPITAINTEKNTIGGNNSHRILASSGSLLIYLPDSRTGQMGEFTVGNTRKIVSVEGRPFHLVPSTPHDEPILLHSVTRKNLIRKQAQLASQNTPDDKPKYTVDEEHFTEAFGDIPRNQNGNISWKLWHKTHPQAVKAYLEVSYVAISPDGNISKRELEKKDSGIYMAIRKYYPGSLQKLKVDMRFPQATTADGIPLLPDGRRDWQRFAREDKDGFEAAVINRCLDLFGNTSFYTTDLRKAGIGDSGLYEAIHRHFTDGYRGLKKRLGAHVRRPATLNSELNTVLSTESQIGTKTKSSVEKKQPKPAGYWSKLNNLHLEIAAFVEQYGRLDDASFRAHKRTDLYRGINKYYPGGLHQARLDFTNSVHQKPLHYWNNINNLRSEIATFVAQYGELNYPTLQRHNRHDLRNGLKKYPGGLYQAQLDFQVPIRKKPNGYWNNINNIQLEIAAFIKEHGELTYESLRKYKRDDLRCGIEQYPGGLYQAQIDNGLTPIKKPNGYWKDVNHVVTALSQKIKDGSRMHYRDLENIGTAIYTHHKSSGGLPQLVEFARQKVEETLNVDKKYEQNRNRWLAYANRLGAPNPEEAVHAAILDYMDGKYDPLRYEGFDDPVSKYISSRIKTYANRQKDDFYKKANSPRWVERHNKDSDRDQIDYIQMLPDVGYDPAVAARSETIHHAVAELIRKDKRFGLIIEQLGKNVTFREISIITGITYADVLSLVRQMRADLEPLRQTA